MSPYSLTSSISAHLRKNLISYGHLEEIFGYPFLYLSDKPRPAQNGIKKHWTRADIPSQIGKIALVTGATGGLGLETAYALAQAGANVIIAGRNKKKGREALARIQASIPDAKIEFGKVDHCSLASIAEFASKITRKYERLDTLINNAGIITRAKRETTIDGFEIVFGTNHLSHFALTAHLLPLLRKSPSPRVVTVSSISHRQGIIDFDDLQFVKRNYNSTVYGQSKLANLLFAFELERQSNEHGWGIMSNAAHPGFSDTQLTSHIPGFVGWFVSKIVVPLGSHSAEQGAVPILFAATSVQARGGKFYGPSGYSEITGDVGLAYVDPKAVDPVVASKLWEASVKLTGVRWPSGND